MWVDMDAFLLGFLIFLSVGLAWTVAVLVQRFLP